MYVVLDTGFLLAFFAGILQVVAYIFYGKKIFSGRIRPNTASWSIWAIGAVLESLTYFYVTGDWVKNILPAVCTLSVIILFIACLVKGRFEKLTRWEVVVVLLDILALFVWWRLGSAIYANFLLVFSTILSFVPIFLHVWNNPSSEHAGPWYIWTLAYFFMTVVVLIRFEKWEDLVYPISYLVLDFVVALLAVDVANRNKIWNFFKQQEL